MHVYFNPHLSQYSYSKDYNACTLLVFCFSNLYLIFVIVAVPNHTENSIFSHTTSWLYFCSYVIYIMHYIANNLNKLFVLRTGKVAASLLCMTVQKLYLVGERKLAWIIQLSYNALLSKMCTCHFKPWVRGVFSSVFKIKFSRQLNLKLLGYTIFICRGQAFSKLFLAHKIFGHKIPTQTSPLGH